MADDVTAGLGIPEASCDNLRATVVKDGLHKMLVKSCKSLSNIEKTHLGKQFNFVSNLRLLESILPRSGATVYIPWNDDEKTTCQDSTKVYSLVGTHLLPSKSWHMKLH